MPKKSSAAAKAAATKRRETVAMKAWLMTVLTAHISALERRTHEMVSRQYGATIDQVEELKRDVKGDEVKRRLDEIGITVKLTEDRIGRHMNAMVQGLPPLRELNALVSQIGFLRGEVTRLSQAIHLEPQNEVPPTVRFIDVVN